MNNVNLFGRVGQDITLSATKGNRYMVKFSLAVNSGRRTDWIPCIAWGSRAELIAKYVCKGDQLIVSGRLRPRKYTDKDEIKRWDMPVEILRVTFVAGNKNTQHFEEAQPTHIPADDPGQDEENP
jgi:single-strand DNA-binding protein